MSHMSIQTIVMSEFRETLIILGFDVRETLLKIWFCHRIVLISADVKFFLRIQMGVEWDTDDFQV